MSSRTVLLALIAALAAASSPVAAKPPARGFWCARWTRDGSEGSTCARDQAACDRVVDGTRRLGADAHPCEWQDTAWSTRIRLKGSPPDWFFAEEAHCVDMASMYGGTTCRKAK